MASPQPTVIHPSTESDDKSVHSDYTSIDSDPIAINVITINTKYIEKIQSSNSIIYRCSPRQNEEPQLSTREYKGSAVRNTFTTGNSFLVFGDKLLGVSIEKGYGALKELTVLMIQNCSWCLSSGAVHCAAPGILILFITPSLTQLVRGASEERASNARLPLYSSQSAGRAEMAGV